MARAFDQPVPLGQLGLSERLREFVGEMPIRRRPILDFIMGVAGETSANEDVLDLGAGEAPYRELFEHARYRSNDWGESVHPSAREADVIAPAWDVPLEDASVDLLLATELLEHIPDPAAVLGECHRLLRPGGRIALTVPFAWQLHELPHDYYRFTPAGIGQLVAAAGFTDVVTDAQGDSFTTIAQLTMNAASMMGSADDGLQSAREEARAALWQIAEQVARLAPLDTARALPVGTSVLARRP